MRVFETISENRNSLPGTTASGDTQPVRVPVPILGGCEGAKTGEDEVLVNSCGKLTAVARGWKE